MNILPNPHSSGEQRRDEAVYHLHHRRPVLCRCIQRAFITHLLHHGPSTSDAARIAVPIPPGVDPQVVGAAIRGIAGDDGLIWTVGRRKSNRPVAHARSLMLWGVRDRRAALAWLSTHPELPEPGKGGER